MSFELCEAYEINLPSTITSGLVGGWSGPFAACHNLITVTIPENNTYTTIDGCIIDKNTKTAVLISKNAILPTDSNLVTTIGQNSFLNCDNIESIGESGTNVDFVIPNNIITMNWEALASGLSNLKTIVIPNTVTILGGENTLYANDNLKYVYFKSSTPPTSEDPDYDIVPSNCKIYVPSFRA